MHTDLYPIADCPCGRLAIMPRPRGGDWLPDEIAAWRRAGIDVVVSLLEPAEVAELGLAEEATVCQSVGLGLLSFPIRDRGVPMARDQFTAFVQGMHQRLQQGQSLAVHCRIGVGRSALVAASVLTYAGQPVEAAWASIQKARGTSVPDTREQREWVTRWLASIQAS